MKTYELIKQGNTIIAKEVNDGANTAQRVGIALQDILDFAKENTDNNITLALKDVVHSEDGEGFVEDLDDTFEEIVKREIQKRLDEIFSSEGNTSLAGQVLANTNSISELRNKVGRAFDDSEIEVLPNGVKLIFYSENDDNNIEYIVPIATATSMGLMSADDKKNLDELTSGTGGSTSEVTKKDFETLSKNVLSQGQDIQTLQTKVNAQATTIADQGAAIIALTDRVKALEDKLAALFSLNGTTLDITLPQS